MAQNRIVVSLTPAQARRLFQAASMGGDALIEDDAYGWNGNDYRTFQNGVNRLVSAYRFYTGDSIAQKDS